MLRLLPIVRLDPVRGRRLLAANLLSLAFVVGLLSSDVRACLAHPVTCGQVIDEWSGSRAEYCIIFLWLLVGLQTSYVHKHAAQVYLLPPLLIFCHLFLYIFVF